MDERDIRARILASHGAGPSEVAELLAYDESPYARDDLTEPLVRPQTR